MKKILLVATLIFTSFSIIQAQRSLDNPLVDSKVVIDKAATLQEEGKYKQAIEAYLTVPVSDTNYADVLHDLALSYYNDSNYTEAEKNARVGLNLFPERNTEWYMILADVYDETNRTELAINTYDSILTQKPYDYLSYFNKGITLFRKAKMDEAQANFQHCVMLNPYYAAAHHFLGRIQLLKGNLVQAMMSFATNLLVTPGNRYHNSSITYLSGIAEMNTSTEEYLKKYKSGKEDDFEMVQDIVASKIALDKKYKLKSDLEDQIVRQLQVLMEKLEFNASDKGFWMQYYVPLFKNIWEKNLFEPAIYYMFSELDLKKVKDYNKKEKKAIETATNEVVAYLSHIRETQEILIAKRETPATSYYIQDFRVIGKGKFTKNAKNEEVVTGTWEFYHSNGRIKSKGVFNENGERKGEWWFYYDNGILKEISNYDNGKVTGNTEIWYDNGLKYRKLLYKADEKDGEETSWLFNGMLNTVINYKMGKKEGIAKYYTSNGDLRTVTLYSNDLQQGEETIYHSNGTKESVVNYENDLATGPYKEYFDNGKLRVDGSFTAGKKVGVWKTFYKDGTPEYLENYLNGELDGEYTSWYKNGKIESKKIFKKGEIDGKKEDFDDDGILSGETIFERGKLRDIKFFDKAGQVISTTTSRKGSAEISFYEPDGSKSSIGFYSKEGTLEGKGTTYYKNGKVDQEANYKNGLLEGSRKLYYENGQLKEDGSYTNNEADGYFVDYYNNGNVSEEGWYVAGDRQGTFIFRDLLGQITSKIYYLDGNIHGVSEYYNPGNKLDYKLYYDIGWFNKMDQYDSTGKLITSSYLPKGEGQIKFTHFDGKSYIVNNYKNYRLNGGYIISNGDGTKSSYSFYNNGEQDSSFTAWHPNGKIITEGKYKNGSKIGSWKYYYYDGTISNEEVYDNGKLIGKNIQYNEDGSIDKELNYKDGELDGALTMYAGKNQLSIVFYYKNGKLQGFSYEDKNGKLLPQIPIVKGSGKVLALFKNGSKSVELEFKEYLVDGPRTLYYPNGKVYVAGQRLNGDEHGEKKIYYPDGKLMKEENYVEGKLHGLIKLYNQNGVLLFEQNYYLGSLHGSSKYYTAGKLTTTYNYYYGVLDSKK
jgi:antitoxin component YwqK of YwqJK toxin-antitoxin module/Tfp pilus assembly protein PilF